MSFEQTTLGLVCDIGSSKRIKMADYMDSGVPFFRSKEIIELSKGNDISTELYISIDQYKSIDEKFGSPDEGDILLTSVGTLGVPYQVERDRLPFYFKDGNLTWLKNFKSNVNPRWVYYWLTSGLGQQKIEQISIGSTQKAITIIGLKSIEIEVPSIEQQNYIVKVLDSLNSKIRTNRQINQSLEEMAQAMFKSWFVDFDPVKAKMEVLEQGGSEQEALLTTMSIISGKSEDELEVMKNEKPEEYSELESTAKLFPSSMVESELGLIPEGWKFSPFEDNLSKTIGGDWGKEEPDEKHQEKVKIIRGTDLPNLKSGKDSTPLRYVESKKLKSRELMHGDIVIEVSGGSPKQPTGRSILITKTLKKNIGLRVEPASFCRLFRPKSEELSYLISCHLEYIYNDGKMWGYQNQSTGISNFQTKVFLSKEMLVIPCNKVLRLFSQQIKPILSMKYESETKNLEDLRDSLLPKLLSGEIEVANA
jgi:type I restriction enzyme S subunit